MSILNTIRIGTVATCFMLAACDGSSSSPVADDAPHEQNTTPSAETEIDHPPTPATSALFSPLSNLSELGFDIQTLDPNSSMICGSGGQDMCMCIEALPCKQTGSCPTFDSHVDNFRRALNHPAEGTKVQCDRAEIGHCGTFRYFAFQGDFHRDEILWFDEAGQLFSRRDWTDYQAYCGERSSIRYQGGLPECDSMVRDELICGEGENPLQSPMKDVRYNTQSFADRALPLGFATQ